MAQVLWVVLEPTVYAMSAEQEVKVDPLAATVAEIVSELLASGGVLVPLDVLVALELVTPEQIEIWRRGGVPYLERGITKGLGRVARILRLIREEALRRGLAPKPGKYVRSGKKRTRLRFSKRGDEESERAYGTHFVSPASEPAREA